MIKKKFIITSRYISINSKKQNYYSKSYKKIKIPYIWFLTDTVKTKNPLDISRKLPFNSGILIRSYNNKNKEKIIKNIINLKKRKVHTVLVSGRHKSHSNIDGAHLPSWLNSSFLINKKLISMSAHGAIDIRKSINIKADIIFISPIFHTTSHPEAKNLGVIKLGLMAKLFKKPVIALGGINNNNISRLKGLPIAGCAGIDVYNTL
ncbi:MAG: thiamine phosphate synthase [Alphaproteobacteria bacterium]|nr:thiamine phosphate synthase [Alphaproteobacteria bacterium]